MKPELRLFVFVAIAATCLPCLTAAASGAPSFRDRLYQWRNENQQKRAERKQKEAELEKKKEQARKAAEEKLARCSRDPSPVCLEVRRCQDARVTCVTVRRSTRRELPGPDYAQLAHEACSVPFSACVSEAAKIHSKR